MRKIFIRISLLIIIFFAFSFKSANAENFCPNGTPPNSSSCKGGDFSTADTGTNQPIFECANSTVKVQQPACARNEMCVTHNAAQSIVNQTDTGGINGRVVDRNAACYSYCVCATSYSDSIDVTQGFDIYPPDVSNGSPPVWGYGCGNGSLKPSQYNVNNGGLSSSLTQADINIKTPPSVNGIQYVCSKKAGQFGDGGTLPAGVVNFVPIRAGDCTCLDASNKIGGRFKCDFHGKNKNASKEIRTCSTSKGEVCDANKDGWPCVVAGVTPTPPVSVFPTIPPGSVTMGNGDSSGSIPGGNYTNATVPLPCTNSDKNGNCTIISTALGIINPSANSVINEIFSIVLGLSGIAAVILIIISGFQLSLSQGNPEKVKEAQGMLTSAIIGLLFIIFSVVILQIIGLDILGLPGFGK